MIKEQHITLFSEEVESLLNKKEICLYEDEEKKIFIRLPGD